MPVITHRLHVAAPIERVFDLSRSVELHVASTRQTGERAVAGVTSGLLSLDDEVTWEARHLGILQRLTSRITSFDRPWSFTDCMVSGAFARFEHQHRFRSVDAGTDIDDTFNYTSPLGPLGRIADSIFLRSYMTKFLRIRLETVKAAAESDDWKRYVEG